MAIFESTYDIGNIVFLLTGEPEYSRMMVISVKFMPNNLAIYTCVRGTTCTTHFEIELTDEEPMRYGPGGVSVSE
jgi:hypothetical protein